MRSRPTDSESVAGILKPRRDEYSVPAGRKQPTAGPRLPRFQKLVDGETNVASDLTQQSGRYIAPRMERHCCDSAVWMPELLVGTALPDFLKFKTL